MSGQSSSWSPLTAETAPASESSWGRTLRRVAGCCLVLAAAGFGLCQLRSRPHVGSITVSYLGLTNTNSGTMAAFIVHVPSGLEVYGNGGVMLRSTNGMWGAPDFANPNTYASDFGATAYPYKSDFLLSVRAPGDGVPWRIAYYCEALPPFSEWDRFRLKTANDLAYWKMPRIAEIISPYKPRWVYGPEMK